MNVLDVVTSTDGTFELKLIKPDDEVKHLEGASSKRSIAIAYNPAAVGEFTCSAFTDAASAPTTRALVKSNGLAKSVRTHNIVPEDMFSSLQMSLNGLEPDTLYDIYCFHRSHGIISNSGATVKTDKGSLTGVSLVPSAKTTGLALTSLTLTFTHEVALASDALIKIKLYENYDAASLMAFSAGTATNCGSQLTITSG